MKKLPYAWKLKLYKQPRRGVFRTDTNEYNADKGGWQTKEKEFTIIGEDKHCYIYGLRESYSVTKKRQHIMPDGIHKTRLARWLTGQAELFESHA